MFVVNRTFNIRPGFVELFLPLMLKNAAISLADEPECHRYDVCRDTEDKDEVFLFELYSSPTAFARHQGMPHYTQFRSSVRDMIIGKSMKTGYLESVQGDDHMQTAAC